MTTALTEVRFKDSYELFSNILSFQSHILVVKQHNDVLKHLLHA